MKVPIWMLVVLSINQSQTELPVAVTASRVIRIFLGFNRVRVCSKRCFEYYEEYLEAVPSCLDKLKATTRH